MNSVHHSKIISISDSKGGIYSGKGMNPVEVAQHKKETGSVINFPQADNISNEELLELEVDLLCLAALENVITEANVSKIKADRKSVV